MRLFSTISATVSAVLSSCGILRVHSDRNYSEYQSTHNESEFDSSLLAREEQEECLPSMPFEECYTSGMQSIELTDEYLTSYTCFNCDDNQSDVYTILWDRKLVAHYRLFHDRTIDLVGIDTIKFRASVRPSEVFDTTEYDYYGLQHTQTYDTQSTASDIIRVVSEEPFDILRATQAITGDECLYSQSTRVGDFEHLHDKGNMTFKCGDYICVVKGATQVLIDVQRKVHNNKVCLACTTVEFFGNFQHHGTLTYYKDGRKVRSVTLNKAVTSTGYQLNTIRDMKGMRFAERHNLYVCNSQTQTLAIQQLCSNDINISQTLTSETLQCDNSLHIDNIVNNTTGISAGLIAAYTFAGIASVCVLSAAVYLPVSYFIRKICKTTTLLIQNNGEINETETHETNRNETHMTDTTQNNSETNETEIYATETHETNRNETHMTDTTQNNSETNETEIYATETHETNRNETHMTDTTQNNSETNETEMHETNEARTVNGKHYSIIIQ